MFSAMDQVVAERTRDLEARLYRVANIKENNSTLDISCLFRSKVAIFESSDSIFIRMTIHKFII